MKIESMQDLYVEQLRDVYSAEDQIVTGLETMISQTSNQRLRSAFEAHLEETRVQRDRIQQIARSLDIDPTGHTCQAMKGLVREAQDLISDTRSMFSDDAPSEVRDAGLIASAQRVEHYEIAAYGTLCTFAEMLGRQDDLRLLKQTLEEEKATDRKLTDIAINIVNPQAQRASV